ncbi:MAG TPA: hypothetical protein VEF72_28040 [Mycobacterium sp.]|nr:hypothetical protein [Mycobacterium sp.]
MPPIQARVDGTVAAAVEQKLRELYAGHAETNYHTAQTRFDAIAADFVAAANAVDVEAAADMVTAPDDQRTAWTQAATLASRLDAILPTLVVACELAGTHIDDETGSLLAMCINTTDQDRRALWAAWESQDGRCGRWAALVKLATIPAAENLADIAPYDRPREIEYRLEPEPGAPHGTYLTVSYDPEKPESPENRPPAEPDRAMIPGVPPRRRMVAW